MVNPYVAVGVASRLADLPEAIRDRRIENENRKMALADRDRRISRENQAQEREDVRFEREQAEWRNRDQDREMSLSDRSRRIAREDEASERDRKRFARDETEWANKDHDRRLALSDRSKKSAREDVLWTRSQKELDAKMRQEGMHDMLTAIERGADPRMVEREFNSIGEMGIQPGTLLFDPQTSRLRFVDSDGEAFDDHIDKLKAIFVPPAAPVKLGKDDRLIDPRSGKEVVSPSAGASGGDNLSKWNLQRASADAADLIRRRYGLGGNADPYLIDDYDGKSARASYGSSVAGQITNLFKDRMSAQEAADMAVELAEQRITPQEARKMAEQRGARDEQDLRRKTDEILRQNRVDLAQRLEEMIADKEYEINQRERSLPSNRAKDGNRPPLSSFDGQQGIASFGDQE